MHSGVLRSFHEHNVCFSYIWTTMQANEESHFHLLSLVIFFRQGDVPRDTLANAMAAVKTFVFGVQDPATAKLRQVCVFLHSRAVV